MLQPIQKDHEYICPNCACVLGVIDEFPIHQEKLTVTKSLDMLLLGSAMEKNVKFAFGRDKQQGREETVLRNLLLLVKQYELPERLALETFSHLKKKNRGFWSEQEPVKQLIHILSKDENYIHIKKLRLLKASLNEKNITI